MTTSENRGGASARDSDAGSIEFRELRPYRAGKFADATISCLVAASEMAAGFAGASLAALLRFGHPFELERFYLVMVAALASFAVANLITGGYAIHLLARRGRSPIHGVAMWTLTLGLVFATLFFTQSGEVISRLWIGFWYAATCLLIGIVREIWAYLVLRWRTAGRLGERLILVGREDGVAEVAELLGGEQSPDGTLIDRRVHDSDGVPDSAITHLTRADRVVLAFDPNDSAIEAWLAICRTLNVHADMAPSFSRRLVAYEAHGLGKLTVWRLATKPLTDRALALKRLEISFWAALRSFSPCRSCWRSPSR